MVLNRVPGPAISMSSTLPTRPVKNGFTAGRPKVLVTIRSNTQIASSSPITKSSTLPGILSIPTIPKRPCLQLDSLRGTTNFKELFVNGELDHSQMGRTVKIDHVVNGVQQSFVLKLMEPPPSSNEEEILSDDFHPAKSPVTVSNELFVPAKQPSTLNKRLRLLRRKLVKKRKQWNYKDYIVRRLLQRCKNKLKKQSFKNLVLSYRTLQKNSLKNKECIEECIDDDCIIID